MEAQGGIGENADVEVAADGGEDAARAVGEKRKPVAAEVVLVGAAYAGEDRMPFVHLPGQPGHGEGKGDVFGIDVGVALQVVGQSFFA